MAPSTTAVTATASPGVASKVDSAQALRASTALLRKIREDEASRSETAKPSLLADADDKDDPEDGTPVWLILTTKKHIVDRKRLKPGKVVLPHPYLTSEQDGLRICLITTDPQRKYKDLITQSDFPLALGGKVKRVIGMEKLKSKYKSYESRRQLRSEYDVFLADSRIITYLPKTLGKVFYQSGSKRPIPVNMEGKRQNMDEQGNKRRKLADGGSKVVKDEVRAGDVAKEIERSLSSALVHLAPSNTTAVKVGTASQTPEQLQENTETVVAALVEKYVPQQWKNVRAVHIKGPNTAALPIWMAEELWEDEADVLEEAPKANEGKKRKRDRLLGGAPGVIEVPGPDGKMRRLEKPSKRKSLDATPDASTLPSKKRKSENKDTDDDDKLADKAERIARKKALREQKDAMRSVVETKPGKKAKSKS